MKAGPTPRPNSFLGILFVLKDFISSLNVVPYRVSAVDNLIRFMNSGNTVNDRASGTDQDDGFHTGLEGFELDDLSLDEFLLDDLDGIHLDEEVV